ncbi:MAG: hypothetical protein HKN72_03465 [Gemmatimonadetes bacterium]|nr:hypothetical protein [Gemmatimonadota bacterium]NNF12254.1 hypothetical protein [Gemmatimonadota bacterium]NNL29958.1 hypothetical protein [Gemmatimonadota bacterium]
MRMWTAVAVATAIGGCSTSIGVDLTGLWVADSYVFGSVGGATVDLIARDGASMTLTIDRFIDARRRVTARFADGVGGEEVLSGEVFVDQGYFEFEDATFVFDRVEDVLILTNESETFDFGSGPEAATLTIRLTQL